jgi:hypothetical protein
VVFQPFAFGAGETVAVMMGGVLSIFNVSEPVAVFPATSVALNETT